MKKLVYILPIPLSDVEQIEHLNQEDILFQIGLEIIGILLLPLQQLSLSHRHHGERQGTDLKLLKLLLAYFLTIKVRNSYEV